MAFNKNVLEYAEMVVTDGNSSILNIQGHSKQHGTILLILTFGFFLSCCFRISFRLTSDSKRFEKIV